MSKDVKELFGNCVDFGSDMQIREIIGGVTIDATYSEVGTKCHKMLLAILSIYSNTPISNESLVPSLSMNLLFRVATVLASRFNYISSDNVGVKADEYTCTNVSSDGRLKLVYKAIMENGEVDSMNVLILVDDSVDSVDDFVQLLGSTLRPIALVDGIEELKGVEILYYN